jgi:hypothetical protein
MKRFVSLLSQEEARVMVRVDNSECFLRELKRVGERVPFLGLLAAQASWLATSLLELGTLARSRRERAHVLARIRAQRGPNAGRVAHRTRVC